MMKIKKLIRLGKGQSLIEVVIAIGILGIIMVGLVSGATVGLKAARLSRERAYAKSLADRKIEEIRTDKTRDPEAFFDTSSSESEDTNTVPVYTISTIYTLQQVGTRMLVQVDVTWVDGGSTYTVEQDTYFTKQ